MISDFHTCIGPQISFICYLIEPIIILIDCLERPIVYLINFMLNFGSRYLLSTVVEPTYYDVLVECV